MVETVSAHLHREKGEDESIMLVAIPFKDAIDCSLEERHEALDAHVKSENEGSNVEIVARQFNSYNRNDGYVYKIWYKKS